MFAMMGIPPATDASNAMQRPSSRARSNSSGPCSASRALLAVTTSLPLSKSSSRIERAGSKPPISCATTRISGSDVIRPKSSESTLAGNASSRDFLRSRTTTAVRCSSRPACRATRSRRCSSMWARPDPTVPSPTMATFIGFTDGPLAAGRIRYRRPAFHAASSEGELSAKMTLERSR